ncbi:hypothetical protein [Sphingomicrobium aestuariivivum]|uniref:hypothetical protein n=1 Tax=Sphingomicrobium aestuariivivum TaxID=1582356 RepID=UPI001FD63D23|nr:hypothetical protein [Sphingomicrobium aestuariivivum]MCJ8192000.1 hypothetical protein [Sphingomicrobium aestuariivivum]
MIATFFEWKIKAGMEEQFRDGWAAITKMLHPAGSYGSSLFTNDKGHYCAFALWPDRETRDKAFAPYLEAPTEHHAKMRAAVEDTFHRMDLDCVEEMWRLPEHVARG